MMCGDEIICPGDDADPLHPVDFTQLKLPKYDIVDTIVDWEKLKMAGSLSQELLDDMEEVMEHKFDCACKVNGILEAREICNKGWFLDLLYKQPAEVEQ